MASDLVLKATAVVLRTDRGIEEVLIIEHPLDEGGVMLQLPAGTVEPNEAPETAVVRELIEETGVTGEVARLAGILEGEYDGKQHRRWVYFLEAQGPLKDGWAYTCDCGVPVRCSWLPFDSATLVEPQQPWLDLARAAR